MKDLNEVVRQKIDDLHSEIAFRYEQLESSVDDFRRYATRAYAYDIVTFLPGKIREIEAQRQKIKELEDLERMLVWMEREAKNDKC